MKERIIMNNELPKAHEVEHHYTPLLDEYIFTRRFLFGLLPYPKDAIIHIVILGFLAMLSQFLWLHNEVPQLESEDQYITKSSFYWIGGVLYFIQVSMLTNLITRRRLVKICSRIEEALGQETGAKFKEDDQDSRKAILVLVSHSRRFIITDFLTGLSLFMSLIFIETLISLSIFNLLNF